MQIPVLGPVGIGTPGRQTGATPGVRQQHCVMKTMMKHHLCFLNRCLGKHHNTLLGGAVEEEEEQMSVHEESHENSDDDLDALAKAREEEAEALTSLVTANRTLREDRDKQHQVRMSRGYFPQQLPQRDRYNKRPERKCVICNGPHWASQCPEKQGKPGEKKG